MKRAENPVADIEIRVIRNERQYEECLQLLRSLMASASNGAKPNDELELLAMVLERYEEERYALTSIDPVDAIALKMAEFGWSQKDLATALGSASRASEILNRKRALSIEHIRVLHRELRFPPRC